MGRRVTWAIWGAAALFVLVLAAVASGLVWQERKAALADGEGRLLRFVSGAEATINRSFLGVDVLLAGMDELMAPAMLVGGGLDPEHASRLLRGVTNLNLQVRDVAILSAEGRVLASAQSRRIDSDGDGDPGVPADFLRSVMVQTVPSLMISAPALSPTSGERVLYFARSLGPGPSRRHVVVAEVPVPMVAMLLSQATEIDGLSVTLERDDGELMASVPPNDRLMGQRLPPLQLSTVDVAPGGNPAVVKAAGRLDGAASLVATRPTLYSAVRVVASLPMESVLDDWTQASRVIWGVAGGLATLVLLAAAALLWHLSGLARARAHHAGQTHARSGAGIDGRWRVAV